MLKLFGLLALSFAVALAQDTPEGEAIDPSILAELEEQLRAQQEENAKPKFLAGIVTYTVFPGVQDGRFQLGDYHTQVVGVKNNAQAAINVTSIQGFLTSPFDFNYFIQNFTNMDLGVVVSPGESITFAYRYAPYTSLDPMAYHLMTQMSYHTVDEAFVVTLHNQTIELFEASSGFNLQQVISFATTIGVGAAVAIAIFRFVHGPISFGSKRSQKARASSGKASTRSSGKEETAAPEKNANPWLTKFEQEKLKQKAPRKSKE